MSYRLQATLPDPFENQLERLKSELGLETSDIVEEALGLFTKAVLEVKRGSRLTFRRDGEDCEREYSSPTLARLEWAAHERERMVLPNEDFDRLTESLENPPKPNEKMHALMRRRGLSRR